MEKKNKKKASRTKATEKSVVTLLQSIASDLCTSNVAVLPTLTCTSQLNSTNVMPNASRSQPKHYP